MCWLLFLWCYQYIKNTLRLHVRSYMFDLYDVMFLVKSFKCPSPCFVLLTIFHFPIPLPKAHLPINYNIFFPITTLLRIFILIDYPAFGTVYPQLICHYPPQLLLPSLPVRHWKPYTKGLSLC